MDIFTALKKNLLLIGTALGLLGGHAFAQATSSTYIGPDNGNWNDPAHWSPAIVPNNSGTATFDVTIDNTTVNLDIDAAISSLTTPGDAPFLFSTDHALKSGATDTVGFGDLEFTAESADVKLDLGNYKAFSGTRLDETAWFFALTAAPGRTATLQFNGAHIVENNGAFSLRGTGTKKIVDEKGADALRDLTHNQLLGFIEVADGATYTFPNSIVNEGNLAPDHGGTMIFAKDLTQIGDLRDPDATGGFLEVVAAFSADLSAKAIINGVLTNYDPATKTLHRGRYNLEAETDGVVTMQVLGGAVFDIVNNDASILLKGNAAILDKNGVSALRNLATSTRSLRFAHHDFTTVGSLRSGSDADKIALLSVRGDSQVTVSGDLAILGGSLEVSPLTDFDLSAPVKNSLLEVKGNLSLAPLGYIRFEVFGGDAMGQLYVNGSAALAGELQIFILPDAPIATSGSLTLLNADSITGHFSNAASGGRVTAYKPTDFLFAGKLGGVITGTFKTTYDNNSLVISDFQPHASMLNISTRLKVQTGDNVAIAGFIVNGISPKKMIVRGIGPSLTSKGVPGALADPVLELHDSTGAVLQTNDNWQEDATKATAITATGIAPTDPKESAIVATLDPGMYTAVLRGANNTSGIGLIEGYDLTGQRAPSEFSNISTRGRVETGDNVMIGGVIIGAPEPAKVIVRSIGPSLASKGVAGSLPDPTLELHDASGTILSSNDNWQDDPNQAAQIQNAMLAPLDPRESALAVSLTPGNYTAIVRGKNSTQGVALVEFYKLN